MHDIVLHNNFFKRFLLIRVFVCIYHMCAGTEEDRRQIGIRSAGAGVPDICEPPIWALGREPRSSARAVDAPNH